MDRYGVTLGLGYPRNVPVSVTYNDHQKDVRWYLASYVERGKKRKTFPSAVGYVNK